MEFQLLSKKKAVEILAEIADEDLSLVLEVCEDICFGNDKGEYEWINLGKIELKPENDKIQTAIQYGFYEWLIPRKDEIDCIVSNTFSKIDPNIKEDRINNAKKWFYQGVQDIVRRLLLLLPTFDPDSFVRMPLKRPTTIVPDTSAVHQGGLDFVAKFLSPMARIKIPAVVYMEIESQMDNYMNIRSNRKEKGTRIKALERHLLSQGGQRALLRMELMSDVEMDRGDLGSDPIRGIITRSDSDPEDKVLEQSKVVKSFADRLIIETARLHRSQVRPDHPLAILTSDQGMARMAMAEGMDVLFFQARNSPEPTGRILTGTHVHPFDADFYSIPLTDVLWECAVSFGGAKLRNIKDDSFLELWALGGPEQLTWYPLHAKDDLIWGYYVQAHPKKEIKSDKEFLSSEKRFASKGYKITSPKMIDFISILVENNNLAKDQLNEILSVKDQTTTNQYVKFLESGKFISESEQNIEATDKLRMLGKAIKELDISKIHGLLLDVPSYSNFHDFIQKGRQINIDSPEIPISKFFIQSYIALGEMASAILSISDKYIVVTDAEPSIAEFAAQAYKCYKDISQNSDTDTELILTGEWLECLALQFNIHPIRVRKLLEDSRQKGVLDFFVEGSTPDTRFPKHTMTVLELEQGKPVLKKIFLYQGNFVTPGFASNRIKIVRK